MAKTPEDDLLLFTPHIPTRVQAKGWTAERQRAFIQALSLTGVVRAAAESVGMSARSAYQLRRRVEWHARGKVDLPLPAALAATLGPGYVYTFAAAWDRALREGLDVHIHTMLPIALEGERVPVIRRGRIIGWDNKFNMRLAMAAFGACRRQRLGTAYDHDRRIAEHTHRLLAQLETTLRLGPIAWPAPRVPESDEARKASEAERRAEARVFGKRVAGMLDPYRPAGTPPRTLARQARDARAAEARARRAAASAAEGSAK